MKTNSGISQIIFKLLFDILKIVARAFVFVLWLASNILETILHYTNQILRAYLFNDPNPNNMNL
jgi:hypothetical protein